jgi:hypothetical protein
MCLDNRLASRNCCRLTPRRRLPGVLILSREYVRKQRPMHELRILLRRWRAGGAGLVPVLHGMSVQELADIRQLYGSEAWCVAEEEPEGSVLDARAGDLQQLLRCTTLLSDQVRPGAARCNGALRSSATTRRRQLITPHTSTCLCILCSMRGRVHPVRVKHTGPDTSTQGAAPVRKAPQLSPSG